MWVWHKVFGSFLGPGNAWSWVLSVMFLVFTLRAVLFKPFMKQMNSSLRMQELQPQMKKLREKYKDDKTRLAEEMMKLNKEAGVNPLGGCLPALIQAPVFIGLFHVLREFKPGKTENYFFSAADVASFVDAKLFGGAPLSSFITMPKEQLDALGGVHSTVVWVSIPLMIMAGIATHMTSRRSISRQSADAAGQAQTAIMNKLMLYVFPLFVVLGGPFFPLAILIYWLSNNTWTFGQLFVAHRIQDRKKLEAAAIVIEEKSAASFSKPKPGARPVNPKKPVISPTPVDGSVDLTKGESSTDAAGSEAPSTGSGSGGASAGSRPAPGARPRTNNGSQGNRKKPRNKR
ncbi:membrane protein insertase YidC [Nakamurella silvestris]|nr:membrane protein insertase YidC [Nakamurella silvestris]